MSKLTLNIQKYEEYWLSRLQKETEILNVRAWWGLFEAWEKKTKSGVTFTWRTLKLREEQTLILGILS